MPDYLVTGCSGGGKTTLVDALAAQGFRTVAEPGRRLIAKGIAPWDDTEVFLRAAIDMAHADLAANAAREEPIFYDRGLLDALAGLERLGLGRVSDALRGKRPYELTVFLAPPWPEIFTVDRDRRHGFEQAEAEYRHLEQVLPSLGYCPVLLPKVPVGERVRFVMDALQA